MASTGLGTDVLLLGINRFNKNAALYWQIFYCNHRSHLFETLHRLNKFKWFRLISILLEDQTLEYSFSLLLQIMTWGQECLLCFGVESNENIMVFLFKTLPLICIQVTTQSWFSSNDLAAWSFGNWFCCKLYITSISDEEKQFLNVQLENYLVGKWKRQSSPGGCFYSAP